MPPGVSYAHATTAANIGLKKKGCHGSRMTALAVRLLRRHPLCGHFIAARTPPDSGQDTAGRTSIWENRFGAGDKNRNSDFSAPIHYPDWGLCECRGHRPTMVGLRTATPGRWDEAWPHRPQEF